MKVSELAEELGVPASTVLAQCQRFNIDASWVGADLRGADVVILRSELAAAEDPLDLTPADADADADATTAASTAGTEGAAAGEAPVSASDPAGAAPAAAASPAAVTPEDIAALDAAPAVVATASPTPVSDPDPVPDPAASAALPPTAVGSMPDLIDEVTPPPTPEHDPGLGGFRLAGATGVGPEDGPRRVPPRPAPDRKTFDRAARNSVVWFVLAVALFLGSNFVDNPWAVAALWLVASLALLVTLWDANRGRRSAATHPERLRGQGLGVAMMALAIAGIAGMVLSISAVIREQPAADAPASVGKLSSVQSLRWGYQRVSRIADEGWNRPAKDPNTCWDDRPELDKVRMDQRVEVGNHNQRCSDPHKAEVAVVFAMGRDADAPYPGVDGINKAVKARCATVAARVSKAHPSVPVVLLAEYPTAKGWDDGDHDVACVIGTSSRKGSLLGS